jgi:phosphoenolpyruvate carboxykinase (ATP)
MSPRITMDELYPFEVTYITNPAQDKLRELALKHTPAVMKTAYGNLNKITFNKARKAQYTYIVATESEAGRYSGKTIDPESAACLIESVRKYVEEQGTLIEVQGYEGLGPRAVGVQWLYTPDITNVAAMQQILAFPREMVETEEQLARPFEPVFRLVMVPGMEAEGMPGGQAMVVDLENWTTYVIGADYFGESKKGALRMLNEYTYRRGGLTLHAGAKAVTIGGKTVTMAILGLSGTGKTTTTFSKQGELTQPIQDDMVTLWPGGEISITENGCFAKTYGLTEEAEPVIYAGTVDPASWTENIYVNPDGTFDFSKQRLTVEEVERYRDILVATKAPAGNVGKFVRGEVGIDEVVDSYDIPADGWDFLVWTQNGRSIIPMKAIKNAADLYSIPPLKYMGILNRDEGPDAAYPGIIRFASPEQAGGYFMLGETTKTSAAGKERGRTRSPFTQPFFPQQNGLQPKRFAELVATMPGVVCWAMNTGWVGGDALDVKAGKALKVKIRHSSAMLEAMLSGTITWKRDPDFGYEIVDVDDPANAPLLAKVPAEILNPVLFFSKAGRMDEYRAWVEKMLRERREFLEKYDVDPVIVRAVCAAC